MPKIRGDSIVTPIGFLSYPNLLTPRAAEEGGKLKYSTAIVFPEGVDVSAIQKAALTVLAQAFFGGDETKAKKAIKTGSVKWPFRKDLEAKGYEERAGAGGVFINARSDRQPGVVYPFADPDTKRPARVPDDKIEETAYPGANAKIFVQPYSFEHKAGGKGVTFGLQGVQVVGGGERLDGRVKAEDAFEVDDTASVDDFENLPGAITAPVPGEEPEEQEDDGTDPLDDL